MDRFVYERFGSRKGLLRLIYHTVLSGLGVYRNYSALDASHFDRLVFICSGNICRSPLAEHYARSLGREAASCGLNCRDGFPADPRARQFAAEQGLSLEDHKTINVDRFEFRDNDLIVVMEPAHIKHFHSMVPGNYKVVLAGTYRANRTPYIHDPFNCNETFFNQCETHVMEAVRGLCG